MFRFEHPEHLYALALLPVLSALFWLFLRWRNRALNRLADGHLLPQITEGLSRHRRSLKFWLFFVSMLFLVIAWANPQWGTKRKTVTQKGLDLFIALDISNSMLCEDIAPSRLERSKRFASNLVDKLAGNRIGLILFAGDAFLASPLTTDYGALQNELTTASPELAGVQGTDLAQALKLARLSFIPDAETNKAIILITDGEDHEGQAAEQLRLAAEEGMIAFAIGVGTKEGGLIPYNFNGRRDYLRDPSNGQPVRTRLKENLLRQMAKDGKGEYFHIREGEAILDALKDKLDQLEKREMEIRAFSEYASYYQYFLAIGLLLLMVEVALPVGRVVEDYEGL